MSTEYLSIYLYCFQFLSSMFYKFSAYTSFNSLAKFIPNFILFDATVNGTVLLISVTRVQKSNRFLRTDLYILQLYWIFLLVLGAVYLGFSIYISSSANSDLFTSSFPNWMPFISISCLLALARTSKYYVEYGKLLHFSLYNCKLLEFFFCWETPLTLLPFYYQFILATGYDAAFCHISFLFKHLSLDEGNAEVILLLGFVS